MASSTCRSRRVETNRDIGAGSAREWRAGLTNLNSAISIKQRVRRQDVRVPTAVERLDRDFDSYTRRASSRGRNAATITRLELLIAASTFERRLWPDTFCQFMLPCSLIERMWKSRWV